ncbi:hypothetical protein DPMN_023656 [Dreissena polymorpha]|uniref:Uncharacterized protein n=1 Tax=Dreissena polymorpha TaxID=45954 RepID=A0A9D4LL46_DREPO|nr:hypothetical protein DPMN_023656 [Dreissena polymorpha]
MLLVSFFRFSPLLVEYVPLDCVDDSVLEKMRQDTRDYIKTPEHYERKFWEDGKRMMI